MSRNNNHQEITFDGGVYRGELNEEGQFHGHGVAKYTSGDVYEGEFREDLFHGKGCYKWADGDVYDGEYYEDLQHGIGTLKDGTGCYTGTWVDDKRHGHGRQTFAGSREVYEGEWIDDQRHGYGRVIQAKNNSSNQQQQSSAPKIQPDTNLHQNLPAALAATEFGSGASTATHPGPGEYQSFYEGGWENNQYHGRGMSQNPDGDLYEGEFERGKPHGQGIYSWANGITYLGHFVDGKKHGEGREKLPQGSWLQGRWIMGMADRSVTAERVEQPDMDDFIKDFREKYAFRPKIVTNPNASKRGTAAGGGGGGKPKSAAELPTSSSQSPAAASGNSSSQEDLTSDLSMESQEGANSNSPLPAGILNPPPVSSLKQIPAVANNSSSNNNNNHAASSSAVSTQAHQQSQQQQQQQQQQQNNNAARAQQSNFQQPQQAPPRSYSNSSNNNLGMSMSTTISSTPTVSDAELEGYMVARLLGKGSFGSVFEALLPSGKQVCVKQIELGNIKSDAELQTLENEINLMKRLHHPNIVEYFGCRRDSEKNTISIFMELVTGGSVNHFVKRLKKVPFNTIKSWTRQVLLGIQYLHREGIIHRDIKGDNILVSGDGIVKLADFGCSKQIDDVCSKTRGCNTMVGTPYWMAPEVIKCEADTGYGAKSDIWSVGCTVVEMITGRPPWPESDSMWAAVFKIANSTGLPPGIPDNLPDDLFAFLLRCFERDPKLRAESEELLQMPWLTTDG